MPLLRRLTVTQRIFFGFALTTLLLSSGLGYSLWLQHQQVNQVQLLVKDVFAQQRALQELLDILSAQRRLESQYGLTSESALLELQYHRRNTLQNLRPILDPLQTHLRDLRDYSEVIDRGLVLQRDKEMAQWKALLIERVQPLRRNLEQQAQILRYDLEQEITATGDRLNDQFRQNLGRALGWSGFVMALGLLLVASVIFYINRAMSELTDQTRDYAKGRFDRRAQLRTDDEFAHLQRSMRQMGEELEELHRQQLDANPLTHLPGNRAIQQQIDQRLERGESFAHVYVDLDDFKAYNDRYGYQAGSAVIAETAMILRQAAEKLNNNGLFIGHIGGDDYVAILSASEAVELASDVVREFDRRAPWFYDEADRKVGYIDAQDRFGVERRYPLMTVSIAVVLTEVMEEPSTESISSECARIKHLLKKRPGSNWATNES